jgi:uncharacterized membrane protein YphA (DoxX/SURF4 family)
MSKKYKIIYWFFTLWLALGMVSTGIVQLIRSNDEVLRIEHLGYPVYFLTLLGMWKVLGVAAVLAPGFPRLKEWAYAGFFFAMSGAAISHAAVGDPMGEILPSLLLLAITLVSWYFRTPDRRMETT